MHFVGDAEALTIPLLAPCRIGRPSCRIPYHCYDETGTVRPFSGVVHRAVLHEHGTARRIISNSFDP